jgi:excinuclease ABC subunit A
LPDHQNIPGSDAPLVIKGARVHNLKNVSLTLPRNALVVITGVSGSGKSSLAFDTIYAEGQRRYVESLSSYARQFLERMDKPDVDSIEGLSPAMAIEQKTNTRNPRSTVGTTTEVNDYLRLLFARIGKTFCRKCGRQVVKDSTETIERSLMESAAGRDSLRIHVQFPLPVHQGESFGESLENLKREGFFRVVLREEIVDLNEQSLPAGTKPAEVQVLVDRLVFRPSERNSRLADAVETAFSAGNGRASLRLLDDGKELRFNQRFACPDCHIEYQEPDPRMFSFNNPFGACPECQGFGRAIGVDMEKVVPDSTISLREGAVHPWASPKFKEWQEKLFQAARLANVRLDVPYRDLTPAEVDIVRHGHKSFSGVDGFVEFLEKKAYKIYYRVMLSRLRGYTECPVCHGSRLKPEALDVKVAGRNFADLSVMTIAQARTFVTSLALTPAEKEIGKRIIGELDRRLEYLDEVGIGYLTLDRLSSTLSGGESQRINLATSLGSSLVGAIYVLDEPSIGLHPRDNRKLIAILERLRDAGNTVIVVEHDADMIEAGDVIVDMGPKAGELGGEVVFAGTREELRRHPSSLTGAYLTGKLEIPIPSVRRNTDRGMLRITGAREHNLRNINVDIPLHSFVCVTGVSGSGKSTFVHEIVTKGLKRALGDLTSKPGTFDGLSGHEELSSVELVDQSPIGRSPRSNPVTYIGVFDLVRNLFASVQSAKVHGMKPGAFSFNVPGGRCDACEGDGVVKVEMQFLADLYLQCEVCKGKRYKAEVLDIRYRGKNIDDVLNLTVTDAIRFFGEEVQSRSIAKKLRVLEDVGLGYVRLGQPATTLSGGEAQRVKLAAHLSSPDRSKHILFVFDEPTTGLHFDDIAKLMRCFDTLIDAGNSVLVIEHHLDVIKCADWVIDLGPEAGAEGGRVVAEGTPEAIVRTSGSHTGVALKSVLGRPPESAGKNRKGKK